MEIHYCFQGFLHITLFKNEATAGTDETSTSTRIIIEFLLTANSPENGWGRGANYAK